MKAIIGDLKRRILFEDENVLVLNKPAGLAVQGGSNIKLSIDSLAAQHLMSSATDKPR